MLQKDAFNHEFGKRVKAARKAAQLKAELAAEAAGISPQFLSDVERGKKGVSNYNLAGLAQALSVSADYLLFGCVGTGGEWARDIESIAMLSPGVRKMAVEVLGAALSIVQETPPG